MFSEPIKVLLVEDNLGDARLLYEGMGEAIPGQFQVTHVRRLSETLEFLWDHPCHVVLLDLGLPDSHGLDTLTLVRARASDVPIVVLTGFDDEELGNRALQEGAQDYLVKGQADSKLLARSMRYAIARKETEQALIQEGACRARSDELLRSRQRLIAAHEGVRRDVAAELREGVRGRLLALEDRLRAVARGDAAAPETARVLGEVIADLHQVGERQLGELGCRLYPAALGQGIASTLRTLGGQLASLPALDIQLDGELAEPGTDLDPFPEPVRLALYRIAEEALANVAQHARASQVTVRLSSPRAGWWNLTVQDDGQGFEVESTPHRQGVATMEDYARALGGDCVIHSSPGTGTQVTAALPLSPAAAEAGAAAH